MTASKVWNFSWELGREKNYSRLPLWENLLVLFFFQIFKLKVISMFCGRTEDRIEVLSVWEGERLVLSRALGGDWLGLLYCLRGKWKMEKCLMQNLSNVSLGLKMLTSVYSGSWGQVQNSFPTEARVKELPLPVSCREVKQPGASLF